ncbi:hypothetical protein [Pantoea sp. CCBC3-3-1]|uniref:hypothetical protein n=1 Tax=Pantoea sp. CCBC3-3-1 TaxID=2490851 RepID=UPI0011BD8A42|nr:hypothetical protein [Pantoea sp. CCBC3-3-1]
MTYHKKRFAFKTPLGLAIQSILSNQIAAGMMLAGGPSQELPGEYVCAAQRMSRFHSQMIVANALRGVDVSDSTTMIQRMQWLGSMSSIGCSAATSPVFPNDTLSV